MASIKSHTQKRYTIITSITSININININS